jgi:uncharacterized protein (DUF433 family)
MLAQKVKRNQGPTQPLTVAFVSIITGVPAKTINQYIDRDFADLGLAMQRDGQRHISLDKVIAFRLAYDFADTLTLSSRVQLIKNAIARPKAKRIELDGGKVIVPVNLARAKVNAGVKRMTAALDNVDRSANKLGSELCLKGTRISVYTIADLHKASGRDAVMEAYDITDQQLDAAVVMALSIPRRGRPNRLEAKLDAAKPKARQTKRIMID